VEVGAQGTRYNIESNVRDSIGSGYNAPFGSTTPSEETHNFRPAGGVSTVDYKHDVEEVYVVSSLVGAFFPSFLVELKLCTVDTI
jgi:hypothetical protein